MATAGGGVPPWIMGGIVCRVMNKRLKWILSCVALFFGVVALLFWLASLLPKPHPAWGVTFSPRYARFLGLDAGEAYHWIIGDLGVKRLRLPLYWDDIERKPGVDDFSEADWYLWDAQAHGVDVTLVIGERSPRWPECHIPLWLAHDATTRDKALLAYVKRATEHFKDAPAVKRWQVENEPFFSAFGLCPDMSRALLDEELAVVRQADPTRPIQLTASGELEFWLPLARRADILGISVYRESWNKRFGYIHYPVPAAFYRLRALFVKPFISRVIISELQAEPWFPDIFDIGNVRDHYDLFTADDFKANAAYASKMGLSEADFWGVEWWYAMKKAGDARLWDAAKEMFKAQKTTP